MAMQISKYFNLKRTRQDEPLHGKKQRLNSAGGYVFPVDCWTRLDRFLILGSEGGSYYASERALTIDNARAVAECIELDGIRVVKRIVEISNAGRAPKNDPAIFALAMCAKIGDPATRKAAHEALAQTCRIGTQLFHFARDLEVFGGWGRGTRRAVGEWYTEMAAEKLAYQAVKYQSRDGWAHRDLLRLAHPKTDNAVRNSIFGWITTGRLNESARAKDEAGREAPGLDRAKAPADATRLIWAYERAKKSNSKGEIVALIRDHKLPREAIPTEWLKDADVWGALFEDMPLAALIRNLATMTRVGFLGAMGSTTDAVAKRIRDREMLRKARIHPIAVLSALMTYKAGRGARGQNEWMPNGRIVDALDDAFYAAFENVEATGKRWMLALDVSGSMTSGAVAGVPGLTPRMASAALALVTAAVEPKHGFIAFTSAGWQASGNKRNHLGGGVSPLSIGPRMRLDSVIGEVGKLAFGGTDCALPMLYAAAHRLDVDVFVVLTDSETWAGGIHPIQALREYREARGIDAKLIVVGMVSNGFSIADPDDAGMLDVVGFDTSVPQLMADFANA